MKKAMVTAHMSRKSRSANAILSRDRSKGACLGSLVSRQNALASLRPVVKGVRVERKDMPRMDDARTQQDASALLVQTGLRCTRERLLVLETLVSLHTPSSVEALQSEVGTAVNKVTLYRMLEQFADAGLVERVAQPDGVRRYEYQSEHHHHITCTDCGTRQRVSVPEGTLTRAVAKSAPSFRAVTSHTLEFYGVCRECER